MVSPDQKFLCSGEVTEWRYQRKYSNGFRAIVFRPVDGSATKFRVVGVNDIPVGPNNTPLTYTVPKFQRIAVKAGDMIGWSFGGGVLGFTFGGDHRVRWLGGGELNGDIRGRELDINGGVQNREYSITAVVGANEPGE